ncbi:hypothetical protein JYK00_04315 [Thermosipho ferrireducens]|uniref:ABC transporter permease n=1 Tax=Thermosipho ferrireducens TaxID=2571116 RepID=A0ABX7S829_9BACT|nr:hypothetical protein [Thermosipho ferrireducens]QTA38739.1 hypothetical protein JYK00_04315 [Thermosipho ferrireducens]
MKNFWILLKYLSNPHIVQNTRKTRRRMKSNSLNRIISYIFGAIPMGIFVYIFSKKIFENLYAVDPVTVKLLFLFWITLLSLFFIAGFVGLAMYSLSRNDEIELLLTMPISRSVLTAYQIFMATVSQIFILIFFIFITISYAIVIGENIFFSIFKIILHITFLIVFSSILGVLFGGKTTKSFTKRFYMIMMLLSVFFYFSIISLTNVSTSNLQNITKFFIFSTKEYNLLAWSFISRKTFLFAFLSTIVLSVVFVLISNKTAFEPVQRKQKNKYLIKGSGSILKAIIKKDLKAAARYERFLYFVLYPLGFSIFMMFMTENTFAPIMYTIPIFTFYIALETGILTISEFSKIDLVSIYPVRFSAFMFPKIFITTSLNFLILFAVSVVSVFLYTIKPIMFTSLLFSIFLFCMSAILGAYFAIRSPNIKSNNMNRIFSIPATFLIEGITMGLAIGSVLPLSLLANGFEKYKPLLILIMIGSIITTIIISWIFMRKLKQLIIKKVS